MSRIEPASHPCQQSQYLPCHWILLWGVEQSIPPQPHHFLLCVFRFVFNYLCACVSVCHICIEIALEARKGPWGSLELWVVGSYHMKTGDQTRVLTRAKKHSLPLGYLFCLKLRSLESQYWIQECSSQLLFPCTTGWLWLAGYCENSKSW